LQASHFLPNDIIADNVLLHDEAHSRATGTRIANS